MDVSELADREAIRVVMARYNVCGDRGDVAGLAACFAADGVLEFPGAAAQGPAAIVAALSGGRPRDPERTFIRHNLTTSLVELAPDRQSATARSYFTVVSNRGLDHSGVYVDTLRRQRGAWLFAHRQVRIDWQAETSLFAPMVTRAR